MPDMAFVFRNGETPYRNAVSFYDLEYTDIDEVIEMYPKDKYYVIIRPADSIAD